MSWHFVRMLIIIISRSSLKLGHVGSKTRLLGQQATQVSDLGPLWPSCFLFLFQPIFKGKQIVWLPVSLGYKALPRSKFFPIRVDLIEKEGKLAKLHTGKPSLMWSPISRAYLSLAATFWVPGIEIQCLWSCINPFGLRMAKTLWSFGHSESKRVNTAS